MRRRTRCLIAGSPQRTSRPCRSSISTGGNAHEAVCGVGIVVMVPRRQRSPRRPSAGRWSGANNNRTGLPPACHTGLTATEQACHLRVILSGSAFFNSSHPSCICVRKTNSVLLPSSSITHACMASETSNFIVLSHVLRRVDLHGLG